MKKALAVIMGLSFLAASGCAHVNTVKSRTGLERFQEENKPVRQLRVLCVVDRELDLSAMQRIVSQASDLFQAQAGISFSITESYRVDFDTSSMMDAEANRCLTRLWRSSQGKHFDVAIGFLSNELIDQVVGYFFADYKGAIDDRYRRFIIVKHKDVQTLLHEMAHAFILQSDHSLFGLMNPMSLQVLPLLPEVNSGLYLSPEDRQHILDNKWRPFGPRLAEIMEP